jgi:dephospho-CoA kinase
MDKLCDFIIAIQCPREVREKRVMERSGMTAEKMKVLMDRQISEADRLMKSQYVIHNTGTIEEAQTKMRGIISHLVEFYK